MLSNELASATAVERDWLSEVVADEVKRDPEWREKLRESRFKGQVTAELNQLDSELDFSA